MRRKRAISIRFYPDRSPIYFSDISGKTCSFLERYLFLGMTYNKGQVPSYHKRTKVGWVFTMNEPREHYTDFLNGLVRLIGWTIGDSEYIP